MGQLGCVSCAVKSELITPVLSLAKTEALVNVCKYYHISKLTGASVKVFIAVLKSKSKVHPMEAATHYIMMIMQEEAFSLEPEYSNNTNSTN